jgi:uncharacterized membrane protein YeaQ/YmgE (transglycosylase-associated protein family)
MAQLLHILQVQRQGSPLIITIFIYEEEYQMLVSLLVWALVGLIAGWLAGEVTKGSGFGVVGNIVVGLLGALIGGFLAQALFGVDPVSGLNITTIITAFIGAVILVIALNALTGRRTTL